ncbi:unnamed protein product [Prunus armeniaca]
MMYFVECDADLVVGPETRLKSRGDSAEFSAESLMPLLLLKKEVTILRSEPGMGVMSGSPQDSSRLWDHDGFRHGTSSCDVEDSLTWMDVFSSVRLARAFALVVNLVKEEGIWKPE